MTDLEKKSDVPVVLQGELRELSTTNKKLNEDLELARYKLKGEIDALTYKIEKIAYETEEIRREVRDMNRMIDKLRYDLTDAIRDSKKSSITELLSNLFPILAIGAPVFFLMVVTIVMIASR